VLTSRFLGYGEKGKPLPKAGADLGLAMNIHQVIGYPARAGVAGSCIARFDPDLYQSGDQRPQAGHKKAPSSGKADNEFDLIKQSIL